MIDKVSRIFDLKPIPVKSSPPPSYTSPYRSMPTQRGLCLIPFFTGRASGEILGIAAGSDGKSFDLVPACNNKDGVIEIGADFKPAFGTVRDPSLFYDRRLSPSPFIVFTTGGEFIPGRADFGVAKCVDGQSWVNVAYPSFVNSIPGITALWAPQFFLDPRGPHGAITPGLPNFFDDGTHASALHVFFSATTSSGSISGFNIYETHPLDPELLSWSDAVAVTGRWADGAAGNAIDPCVVWDGSHYNLWMRQCNMELSDFIVVYESDSLLSGYSPLQTEDWLGLGSATSEAPCVRKHDARREWIIHVDRFAAGTGIHVATQKVGPGDWTSGQAPTGEYALSEFKPLDMPVLPRSGKMWIVA
jgi:hypothetical protein